MEPMALAREPPDEDKVEVVMGYSETK